MESHAVVVHADAAGPAASAGGLLAGAPKVCLPASAPPPEVYEALHGAGLALVDGQEPDALPLAQRVHRVDPALQVAIVAPDEARARIERSILFTPGLGEVWIVPPGELTPALVERAGRLTRTRRRYRATQERIQADLAAIEPHPARRAQVSAAYLAALLEVLPDPVLSIDERDLIVSWNPAAERVLGYTRPEAIGRPLREILQVHEADTLAALLATAAARQPATAEIHFHRRHGSGGIGELTVIPVEAGGQRVRAVVLHDVTHERHAQAELEMQAAELEEQAVELEMANDELQLRTAELEAALGSRSRFYAAMSHELRTPINAIIGFNELLLEGILGPLNERQLEGLQRSQRAARHLLELVNDVLDLAKIEAGRLELQLEPTLFPRLLEELLDTVQTLARQHGVPLLLEPGAEPHTVISDPRRVRQILLNLLSNAIKFGEQRPVHVRWRPRADGGVEVEVEDQGRGISAEDLGRVFEEFEQVEPHEGAGTGLGLPVSRRLAQLLGGRVEATSEVGKGSVFRLVLPREAKGER